MHMSPTVSHCKSAQGLYHPLHSFWFKPSLSKLAWSASGCSVSLAIVASIDGSCRADGIDARHHWWQRSFHHWLRSGVWRSSWACRMLPGDQCVVLQCSLVSWAVDEGVRREHWWLPCMSPGRSAQDWWAWQGYHLPLSPVLSFRCAALYTCIPIFIFKAKLMLKAYMCTVPGRVLVASQRHILTFEFWNFWTVWKDLKACLNYEFVHVLKPFLSL